jgi:hypothetical protein
MSAYALDIMNSSDSHQDKRVLLNAFNDLRSAAHSWSIVLELNPNAATPCGTEIEEWVRYCLTASEPKFASADESNE